MLNIIVELSKYLILIIMLLYTLESFLVFRYEEDYDQRYILRKQLLLIIFLDLTAFLVIFLQTEELKVLYIFGALILYLVIVQALYRALYKTSSILLLNHLPVPKSAFNINPQFHFFFHPTPCGLNFQ